MRILVTGASGQLGSAVMASALRRDWQVEGWKLADLRTQALCSRGQLPVAADWVVHCAANTNVEACERDPDACYRDNFLLTEALAGLARKSGTRLLLVSSTGVYGKQAATPYAEYDAVHPSTHHHKSKVLAEQRTLQYGPDNLVVRTGWLFGGAAGNHKNFVARRIEDARAAGAEGLRSNAQQIGTPCYTADVAMRMLDLIGAGMAGVFNVVNQGQASRFDFVVEILRQAGLNVPVQPMDSSHFQRLADVSDNEAGRCWRMEQLGMPPLPDWRDALGVYLKHLGSTEELS